MYENQYDNQPNIWQSIWQSIWQATKNITTNQLYENQYGNQPRIWQPNKGYLKYLGSYFTNSLKKKPFTFYFKNTKSYKLSKYI